MLLDIEAEVFRTSDHMPIIKLLGALLEQRHEWRPTPAVVTAAETFARECLPKTPGIVEMIHKSLVEAVSSRSKRPTVVVAASAVQDVVDDLLREAVVVVEDQFTEEGFLLALASAFEHHHILDAARKGWLRISHASGKDRMSRFVELECAKFKVVLRVAALLDSDRKKPGPAGDSNQREYALIESLIGTDRVHMWAWREVENYVPAAAWYVRASDRTDEVALIAAMPPGERAYIDFKDKLGKRKPPIIPRQVSLTEDDFAELGTDAVAELRRLLSMISQIL